MKACETTAQFEITGPCPVEGGEVPAHLSLPMVVWVHFPDRIPVPYSHEMCDGKHYRLTRQDAVEKFGCDGFVPWVCEHMGRLIE